MNKIYKIFPGLCALVLAGCSADEFIGDNTMNSDKEGTATFSISTNNLGIEITTRDGEAEQGFVISDMLWLVADTEGNIFDHHYGRLSENFSQLTLEGLNMATTTLYSLPPSMAARMPRLPTQGNFQKFGCRMTRKASHSTDTTAIRKFPSLWVPKRLMPMLSSSTVLPGLLWM